ncbi:GlxA family transcriptional regulator [Luteithermobacter gelatinilyticus]|uniref:GlxA family transcriptional regulator n=1 Tax=Luteithermobacter gelatinilyticus TaxID=2582913 RepID=UPI001105AC8C|nr:GlxA family transcriptional regulator [Luteithermobacter gelatinilyticus]
MPRPKEFPRKTIAFICYDKCEILDLAGPAEIFFSASELCERDYGFPAYQVQYLSLGGGPVRASNGMVFNTQPLNSVPEEDTLIVVGGRGAEHAANSPALTGFLRNRYSIVRRMVSICTGALILAKAGLLEGRTATTHWDYTDKLRQMAPQVHLNPDALYVRDDKLYTSAGVTAGMDLALALVEEDLGRDLPLTVARHLVMFYKRPGGQSQFSSFLKAQTAETAPFRELCLYIAENPTDDLSVPALAQRLALGERTFIRHFTRHVGCSPGRFVEQARLEHSRRLLEDTFDSLEQVALKSGFSSAEILRRLYQRHLGISPREYRERFGRRRTAVF